MGATVTYTTFALGCWLLLIVQGCLGQEILIQGGTVISADLQQQADVLIKDGKIEAVAPGLKASRGAKVVVAKGKYVMPGGIDPHTHLEAAMFDTVACDDFTSGQAAALAGGTTMHIDFGLPTNHDLEQGFKDYQQKMQKAVMDFGLHMAVTKFDTKAAKDMADLAAKGINSFKFFMAYKGALQVTDEELIGGFERCKELGALPMVHAENGDAVLRAQKKAFEEGITGPEGHYISRPDTVEDEATYRAIKLAEVVNVPLYVVHVMSSGAAALVAAARAAGQRVIGEAIASGIGAYEASIFSPDFKVAAQYVMSPPIRNEEHQRKLRHALAGGALQIVATDHCAFNSSQKAAGLSDFRKIPNGVNGIEGLFFQHLLLIIQTLQERMHVTWDTLVNSGMLTPSDFVRVTSTAVAETFNIYPRKGLLAPGSDADVIILDPSVEHTLSAATHHSAMDTNIYEGRKVTGKVVMTISQGKIVWDGSKLHVQPGAGRFIELPTFGRLFEGLDKMDASYLARTYPYGTIPVQRLFPMREEL